MVVQGSKKGEGGCDYKGSMRECLCGDGTILCVNCSVSYMNLYLS